MLFQDKNAEEFNFDRDFPSKWKVEKAEVQRGVQTQEREFKDAGSQMITYDDKGVQANRVLKKERDEVGLNNFLIEARELMEKEIEASRRSRAFEGYQGLQHSAEESVYKDLHNLGVDDSNMRVSSMSWNQASTTIAVGYMVNEEHHNWCSHATNIHIWNLTRRSFNPKEPYLTVPCPTCISCLSYHPSDSEAFAAGGCSGELIYFNSKSEETSPIISGSNGHHEKITCLDWTTLGVDGKYLIVSAGLDGKILIWLIDEIRNKLDPVKEFGIHAENLPRSLKLKSRTSSEVGITALSLNTEDRDGLIVGTEAGVILFTSIGLFSDVQTEDWMAKSGGASTLFYPVHKGQVMDLDFSPFQNKIFLSSGSDMEIRLYNTLHPQSPIHVLSIESIAPSITWSRRSPSIFTYLCQNNIQCYNFINGKMMDPIETGEENPSRFCITRDGKLASMGLSKARIRIFRVKEELVPGSENQKFAQFISDNLKE